jgi:hypothetical protein
LEGETPAVGGLIRRVADLTRKLPQWKIDEKVRKILQEKVRQPVRAATRLGPSQSSFNPHWIGFASHMRIRSKSIAVWNNSIDPS